MVGRGGERVEAKESRTFYTAPGRVSSLTQNKLRRMAVTVLARWTYTRAWIEERCREIEGEGKRESWQESGSELWRKRERQKWPSTKGVAKESLAVHLGFIEYNAWRSPNWLSKTIPLPFVTVSTLSLPPASTPLSRSPSIHLFQVLFPLFPLCPV